MVGFSERAKGDWAHQDYWGLYAFVKQKLIESYKNGALAERSGSFAKNAKGS